jgi:hypothetical protein
MCGYRRCTALTTEQGAHCAKCKEAQEQQPVESSPSSPPIAGLQSQASVEVAPDAETAVQQPPESVESTPGKGETAGQQPQESVESTPGKGETAVQDEEIEEVPREAECEKCGIKFVGTTTHCDDCREKIGERAKLMLAKQKEKEARVKAEKDAMAELNRHLEAEKAAITHYYPETRTCKLCNDAKNTTPDRLYCLQHQPMINVKTKELLSKCE